MQLLLLFQSSIGKKILMAVSGLFYCGFLLGHLSGNFLLFVGKKEFNDYSDFLTSTSLIYIAEAVLILALVVHVFTAISLVRENRKARGSHYKDFRLKGATRTNSTYMGLSGLLILAFLVLHIYTFKFGDWDNQTSNTLYDLVLLRFTDAWYSGIYVFCMICMGVHLNHAFKSSFHTLGLIPQQNKTITRLSSLFALAMTVGFSSFPIYFYCIGNFFS
jgi:succinate dehydrogenase / fumarate reductase cytochrome b subunit